MKFRVFLLSSLAVLAFAKEPSRPECIAPAQPGGGFDLTCKLVQTSFAETKLLSKPMRVTYLPGGVGVVAYNSMINSRPKDGNAIVAFSSGTLLNIATGKHGKYNENDVRWLASGGVDYAAVGVKADSPYKSLQDLLNALKKDPKSVSFGAGGSVGGQDWMTTALLAKVAGVDIKDTRYVAFEGGGDSMISLLGGHIDAAVQGMAEFLPQLESGSVRVLAVFADHRLQSNESKKLAEVPTAKELGYDVVWPTIRGYYMAPKVSDKDYNWWLEAISKLQQTEEFKKQREFRGLFEFNKNGKELEEFVKTQTQKYRELAKEFDLVK